MKNKYPMNPFVGPSIKTYVADCYLRQSDGGTICLKIRHRAPEGTKWSVSNFLPVWSSMASLQEFLKGATGRIAAWIPWGRMTLFCTFAGSLFKPPKKRSRWLPRAAHGEAKRHFREILAPKWPPKLNQKVIEFWLQWNCDFCYPSHAKSRFSLPKTPPKIT